MTADDLLSRAALAIRAGGKETLRSAPAFSCAHETHEPFRLMNAPAQLDDGEQLFLWGSVRTSGAQFDGDRSDVHDVLSLVWGALLRAFGLASPWLIDEPHVVVPGERGARHLLLRQCPWDISDEDRFAAARKSMNAWSALGFHLLDDVFTWSRGRNKSGVDVATVHQDVAPKWAEKIVKYLRNPSDITVSRRTFPLWIYLASPDRGVTVIRMAKIRLLYLKVILMPFVATSARGEDALAIFANGLANAVPFKLIEKARKILALAGDAQQDVIVLPLDSHCLLIGDRTIVALRENCGREVFQREREFLLKRRQVEDRVFFADSSVEWLTPLNSGDFEDLCVELLRREPGVIRAKPVGSTNDRDGGRDILVDWRVPVRHPNSEGDTGYTDAQPIRPGATRIRRIIAQVKSRSRTLGKKDVRDVRDMLEHYGADAYFLIAHPNVSTSLVDYLDGLRGRTAFGTEWWEARDIEDRLRRHPDVAKRYPALVKLIPTGLCG
ncbi:MAG: restriction endonuclease [Rhodospirillaceae bacterium]|nr:restriction endonuclease [Rhodospirillaceae bacterium]